MNKKIFTLLASSLMLLFTAFAAHAFTPALGDTVKALPEGQGKGAYHLAVSYLGGNYVGVDSLVLAIHPDGYVYLPAVDTMDTYAKLRSTLWCVNQILQENQGREFGYQFTNKEYGVPLSFDYDADVFTGDSIDPATGANVAPLPGVTGAYGWASSAYPANSDFIRNLVDGYALDAFVPGGDKAWWTFSFAHYTTFDTSVYLASQVGDDIWLTLAVADDASQASGYTAPPGLGNYQKDANGNYVVKLVLVHGNDLVPGSDFYESNLLRFTLISTAPVVLNKDDFNSKFGAQDKDGTVKLYFDPDYLPTDEFSNPFTDYTLQATKEYGSGIGTYLGITAVEKKQYVRVLEPGDDGENYYNELGNKYLKLGLTTDGKESDYAKFRFVYYPTEDSLIINAYQVKHVSPNQYFLDGTIKDPNAANNLYGIYDGGVLNPLYNDTIWDYLIVRAQTLDANKRLITVADRPSYTRINFNNNTCDVTDDSRTTVPTDLYLIRKQGPEKYVSGARKGELVDYYLTVPIDAGDQAPRWVDPTQKHENPLETPSYHWLVQKINTTSDISRVHAINREFEDVSIKYVQIYKKPMPIGGRVEYWHQGQPFSTFNDPVHSGAIEQSADYTSFVAIKDSVYRNNPFVGYKYIHPDTLNWYAYSLHWWNAYSDDYYIGFKSSQDTKTPTDTTIYLVDQTKTDSHKTYFEFLISDSLRKYVGDKKAWEYYGIGYAGKTKSIIASFEKTDPIATLTRGYYHLVVNDYYNYYQNTNIVVIGENQRYGYTDSETAAKRQLGKGNFYLRYTYDKGDNFLIAPTATVAKNLGTSGQPYYSLIDRIKNSDFHFYNQTFNEILTDTLKAYDWSHGQITDTYFGAILGIVDQKNLYLKASPKQLTTAVDAFALEKISEPLYRDIEIASPESEDTPIAGPALTTGRFYRSLNPAGANTEGFRGVDYLFEDQMGPHSYIPGYAKDIHYLGSENRITCASLLGEDPAVYHHHLTHNYNIYVDTAYVNRGTGRIKPQYLLVLRPTIEEAKTVNCGVCGEGVDVEIPGYVYGWFLRNATDSARVDESNVQNNSAVRPNGGADYIYENWDRLIFTPAVHIGDTLYILNGKEFGDNYVTLVDKEGNKHFNYAALQEDIPESDKKYLGNNLHKDEVFSFRYVYRQMTADGKSTNNPLDFFIESETTDRDVFSGRMIAPMKGGWVKIHNDVAVISRGAYESAILEAELFNVEPKTGEATAIDEVAAAQVTVIGGKGTVTILNAAGKKVVLSNILGQTVANTVLTSDNATLSAPAGVVVVAIAGEDTVKAIVK